MLKTSGKPSFPHVWHLPEIEPDERNRLYGVGTIEMADVLTAGEFTTVTFKFTMGETGLPMGGRLRIAWRWPLDWSDLQSDTPQEDGYMTVSVESVSPVQGEAPLFELIYHQMGDLDPWMHCVELVLRRGQLVRGDQVRLVCGDSSGRGMGWRAPTCRVKQAGFLMLLNPDNSDRWIQLLDPPSYAIQAGSPKRLVAVAPAQGEIGKRLDVLVRAEDRWGNAASLGEAMPQLDLMPIQNASSTATMTVSEGTMSDNPTAYRFSLSIDQPGSYCIAASISKLELRTQSNPFHINTERPHLQLFWGDLHSGQTEIGCGAGSLIDHYHFARDVAGLQFVTHQANDHYITRDLWQHTREQAIAFDDPHHFVVFLGCEWSPPTKDGGDRNVIYHHDEARLRRSGRFFTETDPDPEPDIPTAPDFHAAFRDEPIMVNMHVGGRPTNLDYHAPELEPLAEIHSTHGTSEWFVEDALSRGYKVGITAGADGVAGRPGADHPGWRLNRNVRSGITGVYAAELNKESLWEAFQARRCYGTTGKRIRLWVEVDGHPMGSTYKTSGYPRIKLEVEGTAAIERIDLLRGTQVLCRWQIASYHDDLLRILWSGARSMGTAGAQRLVWDGTLRATAGIFSQIRSVGFQSAADDVNLVDDTTLAWRSATAGNAAGFIFRWDTNEAAQGVDALCRFDSPVSTFEFSKNQVRGAPMTIEAGYVNSCVQIGPAPKEDGPHQIELSYLDTKPLIGETPYWIRVVQVDQEKAWSSPVYISSEKFCTTSPRAKTGQNFSGDI
ncbi:DUF3604 domain-containing protein [Chloroflexi bacterium TSY]|nr:DUF3604 domain-containing protein [Chloroflexi bacterium TSY]